MIFFAAADPEGNCHEKCQQLGDGNGKPDTVRAVFIQAACVPFSSSTDLPFPFTEKAM